MAEFAEVIRQFNRMCECNIKRRICHKQCPLYKFKHKAYGSCTSNFYDYPQEVEEIIMKWAEENPIKKSDS